LFLFGFFKWGNPGTETVFSFATHQLFILLPSKEEIGLVHDHEVYEWGGFLSLLLNS
jgi:hypothetical protein